VGRRRRYQQRPRRPDGGVRAPAGASRRAR
jgi:hypothetical protein